METIQTITFIDLMNQGYSKGTSQRIIREGKKLLVDRGFYIYQNKRIGRIPKSIGEELIGFYL